MAYWMNLRDAKSTDRIRVCDINECFGKHFPFYKLHGRRALDTIPEMKRAIDRLGIKLNKNLSRPTKGNVGMVIIELTRYADAYPSYMWEVL